ncbi:MAG: HAD family hydrolase [Flavobacteriaceae bacterium]
MATIEGHTLKNIFFDFDGVLAESVTAKTEAFREMYLPHGKEIADAVVEYHIGHGGISRYEKFKVWEKQFFGKEIDDAQVQQMANRFSELVLQKVIDADEVPGSMAFLKKYYNRYNFWIITGTPTKEITVIVDKRGIAPYFKGVHGSPENKRHWTEYLINTHNLKREETLFLGDATTDQDAANFSNLHFALRDNDENKDLFKEYKGTRFRDFYELEALLQLV